MELKMNSKLFLSFICLTHTHARTHAYITECIGFGCTINYKQCRHLADNSRWSKLSSGRTWKLAMFISTYFKRELLSNTSVIHKSKFSICQSQTILLTCKRFYMIF